MKKNNQLKWYPIILITSFIILWEIGGRIGFISPLFFPKPSTIGQTISDVITSGEMVTALTATFKRLFTGWIIGSSFGLLLGLAMGWSKPLQSAIDPIIAALHPIPKI